MKPFVDIENFMEYLNQDNLSVKTPEIITVNLKEKDYIATLLIKAEHDYKENFTVEFILKFEHKKYKGEGTVFQKEFKIEHHPKEKSKHTDPHVQIYIHGPSKAHKIGEVWITLPLKEEDEYIQCIKGFFSVLEDIIRGCEPDLEKGILNIKEIKKLIKPKQFLITKINESLNNSSIEYQTPEGKKIVLNPNIIPELLKKDQTLLPFFDEESQEFSKKLF